MAFSSKESIKYSLKIELKVRVAIFIYKSQNDLSINLNIFPLILIQNDG
jgi:hypothetical protein